MHLVKHDDIVIKLEIKSFKVLEELTIANEKIETQKKAQRNYVNSHRFEHIQ